jgi:hypothetical protein
MNLVAFDKNVHNCKFAGQKSLTELAFAIAQKNGDGNFCNELPPNRSSYHG